MRPADELGPILASRGLATTLRERLEAEIEEGGAVIDFEGVETMSPSFADELLAKLPAAIRADIKLINLSDDLRALVDAVSARRTAV